MATSTQPMPLAKTLREFAGSWVAVDRRTGEAVEAAETPYALSANVSTGVHTPALSGGSSL